MKGRIRALLSHPRVAPYAAIMAGGALRLSLALVLTQMVDAAVPGWFSAAARAAFIAAPPLTRGVAAVLRRWLELDDPAAGRRDRRAELLARVLVGMAGALAGRRHAHLREAWAADLGCR